MLHIKKVKMLLKYLRFFSNIYFCIALTNNPTQQYQKRIVFEKSLQ